jgi:hypothetical protein
VLWDCAALAIVQLSLTQWTDKMMYPGAMIIEEVRTRGDSATLAGSPTGGNPLTVVLDAARLDATAVQDAARQSNHPANVFGCRPVLRSSSSRERTTRGGAKKFIAAARR